MQASIKDIIQILNSKHKELIDKIGLGLVTLSVPINEQPYLKVTVLSIPENTLPEYIEVEYNDILFKIPIKIVLGKKITPCIY